MGSLIVSPFLLTMYICPVCHLPLTECSAESIAIQNNQTKQSPLRCENGHSFDRHKKGYINLLLVQNKRTKQPGDDALMVAGRRSFLEAGYYQAFADKLADSVLSVGAKTVLDAGCGEGFYLNHLLTRQSEISAYGFDISKPAIQSAAGQYKHIEWAVASSARLPYGDESFDVVMSIFSRVESQEFSRVLKPGGYVLFAGPGAEHLLALRQLIYSEVRSYQSDKHKNYFTDDYALIDRAELKVPLTIMKNEHIRHLLTMTPHGQRVNAEAEQRLQQVNELNDVADFQIYLYKKLDQ